MPVISGLQLGARVQGKAETLSVIQSYAGDIKNAGAKLVVLPEALLGGYPKGADFGARVGFRTDKGRQEFRQYWENAIDVPGDECDALAALSAQTGASLVIGVIERAGATLFCTALFFDPVEGLVGKHRKLMPTGSERLIWGQGDGSTMPAVTTELGPIGAAICWENYMPHFRSAMYAKGLSIWCAPTVDDRDIWQSSMRHIAYEGRCFLVSACQYMPPPDKAARPKDWPKDKPFIRGGSVIISPMGEILVEPLYGREGLVSADIDLGAIIEARYDLDVAGHYARPDIFSLQVDEQPKHNVEALNTAAPRSDDDVEAAS